MPYFITYYGISFAWMLLHNKRRIFRTFVESIHTEYIKGDLGHDSALQGYTGPGKTSANEMNFGMIHAPDAVSIGVNSHVIF